MRVAIVHYWFASMRGGEKVVESLCRMFPDAEVYTHIFNKSELSETLTSRSVSTTFISKLPFAKKAYQFYLPLMPGALEALDLTGYDLVISSEAGPAKGVIVAPDALHLCYCHSPMRYLWDQYHVYLSRAGLMKKLTFPIFAPWLRQWDVTSAARVDGFIANSHHVANRIKKYWRRDSSVVFPPVAIDEFAPAEMSEVEDYYLWVGELAPYKKPDLMIEAFNNNGKKLIVIGGPEKTRKRLQKTANKNIEFLGKTNFKILQHHMSRCRALIFPGEEDFGIVPVEVMASGRPVIAFAGGGALDTIIDGITGTLFEQQSVEGLSAAIEHFETDLLPVLDPAVLVAHASKFDEGTFRSGIIKILNSYGVNTIAEIPPNQIAVAS